MESYSHLGRNQQRNQRNRESASFSSPFKCYIFFPPSEKTSQQEQHPSSRSPLLWLPADCYRFSNSSSLMADLWPDRVVYTWLESVRFLDFTTCVQCHPKTLYFTRWTLLLRAGWTWQQGPDLTLPLIWLITYLSYGKPFTLNGSCVDWVPQFHQWFKYKHENGDVTKR